MFWLFGAARRLKDLGILGMNRRNAAYILDHNPRAQFPLVDDKLRMRDLCVRIGVPTPEIYAQVAGNAELRRLPDLLGDLDNFVIKPNRGSAGRGVLVLQGRHDSRFLRHNGEPLTLEQLRQHFSDILSGMYSLAGQPDSGLIQQRVRLHPAFAAVAFQGIPDIRVILFRGQPAMAMLRLPTRASNGRANLHQGGLGVGIDIDRGVTTHAVQRNRVVHYHPDTRVPVVSRRIPFWKDIVELAQRVARRVGLGYLGVDIVLDELHGPMLLEANARPGLAIQIANGCGLVPRLLEIEHQQDSKSADGNGKSSPTVLPMKRAFRRSA
jgi:alpha-L-glutamate ligase-like protein